MASYDALAVASAAGRAVPRISVGTAVVPINPRHPQILASAAKTAQAATGGRFQLGIGLGAKDYGPWAVVTGASGGGCWHRQPAPPPGTGATRMDPAIRSRARLVLPALPFAVIAAIGVSRVVMGPGWGMLLLLAVGPAVAAAVGGPLCTLAAGAAALAAGLPFAAGLRPAATHRLAEGAFLSVAGVTAAGVLASRARRRRDRGLAQTPLVAEAPP